MDMLNANIPVPDWVEWIAIDEDGTACGYADEPHCDDREWIAISFLCVFLYQGKPPKNWKAELYTWE